MQKKEARKKRKSGLGLTGALDKAIERIQNKLASDESAGSVADLVRLLQLRNELSDTRPRQLTVRWVDECQTKSSEE
jgi:hypothetical protein